MNWSLFNTHTRQGSIFKMLKPRRNVVIFLSIIISYYLINQLNISYGNIGKGCILNIYTIIYLDTTPSIVLVKSKKFTLSAALLCYSDFKAVPPASLPSFFFLCCCICCTRFTSLCCLFSSLSPWAKWHPAPYWHRPVVFHGSQSTVL